MTQIIGFAGKKQSGKNTACNFILMLKLIELRMCNNARLNEQGEIEVTDVVGQRTEEEWVAINDPRVNTKALMDMVKEEVRLYAFADALKRIAIDVLGLPEDKVYGSDSDKMELTDLRWEDMPGVITRKPPIEFTEAKGRLGYYYNVGEIRVDDENDLYVPVIHHLPGRMTIREVLQFMGTEIFRRIYSNVWVDTLLRRIENEKPKIALICDCRFDNELNTLSEYNAITLGLLRNSESKDSHASEKVNLDLCTAIIDNRAASIVEQNEMIYRTLHDLKCKNIPDLKI